jgi:hypothetical protein
MSGQVTVTFRGFTDALVLLNLPRAQKSKLPLAKSPGTIEESLIRTGLQGASLVSTRISSLLALLTPPPYVSKIVGTVSRIPIRRRTDFTIAVGFVASAGAGVSAGLGGGVYFWNKSPRGEVGLFGTISVGFITNIGAGAGDSFAYLFDAAPTVLAGDIIALEVDVEIGVVTVGGQLFITAPPATIWPPALTGLWVPEIVGVGFQVTMGISVAPVNIAVTPSRTWIKPITP